MENIREIRTPSAISQDRSSQDQSRHLPEDSPDEHQLMQASFGLGSSPTVQFSERDNLIGQKLLQ